MDSEEPPAKRQRVGDPDPVVPTRSEPWFQDGTIILQASETQFRVYRGILSATSVQIYVCHATARAWRVQSCSVVCLSDSADDWRFVLNALHDSGPSHPT
jgi:hypothetical protein